MHMYSTLPAVRCRLFRPLSSSPTSTPLSVWRKILALTSRRYGIKFQCQCQCGSIDNLKVKKKILNRTLVCCFRSFTSEIFEEVHTCFHDKREWSTDEIKSEIGERTLNEFLVIYKENANIN